MKTFTPAIGCRMVTYGDEPEADPGGPMQFGNLGDIVQTVALSRFLPPSLGVLRGGHELLVAPDAPFVVNGFFYWPMIEQGDNVLFAGVHVDRNVSLQPFLPWFQGTKKPIGARDPAMQRSLTEYGLTSVMIGCATLTFDRYDGPREGVYSVDCNVRGETLTHMIPKDMPLATRWQACLDRLDLYRHAAHVYTAKMHAFLPCLAFGTPVTFVPIGIYDESRLSLLDFLGVEPGVETVLDVTPMRKKFIAFLTRHLNLDVAKEPHAPICPIPCAEYLKHEKAADEKSALVQAPAQ